MIFTIDLSKYKLIDLSKEVVPGAPGDRPFDIRESLLADGTYKYDIHNTHTHVGTHVESPWHYYHRGKTITDFPLEHFMGNARLFHAVPDRDGNTVSLDSLRQALDPYRGQFDILVIRNASDKNPLYFGMESVEYIRDLSLKLLVFECSVSFGRNSEEGRRFHDLLMSRDTCLVEFPEQLNQLDRDEFYLIALPMRVQGLDSAMCRLMAVVEK